MKLYYFTGEPVSALINLDLVHLQWKTALHQAQ